MPKPKKHVVNLTEEQRAYLQALLKKGTVKARVPTRARILLADEGRTDCFIAEVLQVSAQTAYNIRKRFAEEGLEGTLQERPRPGAQPKLAGKQEAFLNTLACSEPPAGRERWTMQLLADKLVESMSAQKRP